VYLGIEPSFEIYLLPPQTDLVDLTQTDLDLTQTVLDLTPRLRERGIVISIRWI